jgi:U3 small nucleolar RNA-associated protein 25
MHKMYHLHVLNHVLTSRMRISRHNRQLKEMEKKEKEDEKKEKEDGDAEPMKEDNDDGAKFRDQGFTRPTVLVLLPTRGTCHQFVHDLIKLVGSEMEREHMERFETDYGKIVNEDEEPLGADAERRRKAVLGEKGKDWNEMFGDDANQDDDFKMGIALTPKAAKGKNAKKEKSSNVAVKLYTDFYKSDIIVASPLGLKMLVAPDEEGKDGDSDFLSSIEICLVEYADVLMMQNWDHAIDLMNFLNKEPANNNNTDFSRVRNYLLEGQGAHWRQLIISTNIIDPSLGSAFKRFGKSVSGSVKIRRKMLPEDAAISNVIVPIKQVFQKVGVSSFEKQSDARVNYFVKTILPQILRHDQKHTMIYVPSYFDFVALRNIFLKRELDFVSVTEYSRTSEVSRGRARFLQGRKPIMLFTGRCDFFHRHAIKGIRHLIFLGLPEHPEFYANQVNLIDNSTSEETDVNAATSVASCLALFTKYEAHALDRIAGSSNCSRMLSSQKATFMFYS